MPELLKSWKPICLLVPYTPPPTPFRASPLGVVSKKRLNQHLSFPKGPSVSNGIPLEHTRVYYATIKDAINHIKVVGTGAYLAYLRCLFKMDIKSALGDLPINPIDYGLLRIK